MRTESNLWVATQEGAMLGVTLITLRKVTFLFFQEKQRELSGKVVDKYPVAESLMRLVAFFCFKRKKNQRLCEKTGWIDFMCGWSNRRNGDDVGVRPIIFEQL